jgi:thiamine biosynthesis lipoprotein
MSNKISRCRPLLGTYVEIQISSSDASIASENIDVIDKAYEAMTLCARLMSFHDKKSDLSLINKFAYSRPVKVHPWTYAVLKQAKAFYEHTDGLFDIGIGAELRQWGLLPEPDLPHAENNTISSTIAAVELLPDHQVKYANPACLDLGGIAKGYAVDKAIEILRKHDIDYAVVNAGGDLRVTGNLEEPIYVRHPMHPEQLIFIGTISEGAVATSASYFSTLKKNTKHSTEVCALVHAKKRTSIIKQHSYTVIAPTCMAADALTKVLASGMHPESYCFKKFQAKTVVI